MAASFMRPYRWVITGYDIYTCPVCDEDFDFSRTDDDISRWHFCPCCGNHLLAPEEDYD